MMDNKKIKKVILASILAATLITAGGAVEVADDTIDHTTEICPISKIFGELPFCDAHHIPLGLKHQLKKIKEECQEQGMIDVLVTYGSIYETRDKYKYSDIEIYIDEYGNKHYDIPNGYEKVKEENGFIVVRKKESYEQPIGSGFTMEFDYNNVRNKYDNKKILIYKKLGE